jgi:hypothetical protein
LNRYDLEKAKKSHSAGLKSPLAILALAFFPWWILAFFLGHFWRQETVVASRIACIICELFIRE